MRERLERTPGGRLRPGQAGTSLPPSVWGPTGIQPQPLGSGPFPEAGEHGGDQAYLLALFPRAGCKASQRGRAWLPRFKRWPCLSWQHDLEGHALLGHQAPWCNVRTTVCPSSQFAHGRSSSERVGCHPRGHAPQELPPPQAGHTGYCLGPGPGSHSALMASATLTFLGGEWAGGWGPPERPWYCPRPPVEEGRARSHKAFRQTRAPRPRDPIPSRHDDYLLIRLDGVLGKSTARRTLPGSRGL